MVPKHLFEMIDKKIITVLHIRSYNIRTMKKYADPVVQSVARPTAEPGVASSILTWSHTFVEIDHEITLTVILLLLLIHKDCC